MANTPAKNNNKGTIIGICSIIVAVIIIVVLAIAVARRGESPVTGGESFFTTDSSKIVLDYDKEDIFGSEEVNMNVKKIYRVFHRTEDAITGLDTYFEFESEEEAGNAKDEIRAQFAVVYAVSNEDINNYLKVEGKYVVMTALENEYSSFTPQDIEKQIEAQNPAEENTEDTTDDNAEQPSGEEVEAETKTE